MNESDIQSVLGLLDSLQRMEVALLRARNEASEPVSRRELEVRVLETKQQAELLKVLLADVLREGQDRVTGELPQVVQPAFESLLVGNARVPVKKLLQQQEILTTQAEEVLSILGPANVVRPRPPKAGSGR